MLSTLGIAAAEPDFAAIDAHVAAIERPASGNITEFVQRLVKPARNDLGRVRAIAWWLACHIEYDHDMHRVGSAQQRSGQTPLEAIAANKPPEVMRRGKAVCSGYAALDKAATAHAEEMARQRATPPRPSCLVAAVDTPPGGLDANLARRFVGSMIEDPGRRSWACAPMHARVGIGAVQKEGRVYFCIEFR